ncbi:hypothetical protein AAG570_013387 [Ranatra chinensis]|uniref:Secreted protein n=1 Tax=Ranatra chinensis TaxID=642074 RepID=A0ABD0YC10_9HEMI
MNVKRLGLYFFGLVFFLVEFPGLLGCGVLVLLVLGDEVVHVGLGLGELHLVHPLARVPVEERLPPEHGRELLRHPLEQLLYGRRVADEGGRHLESPGRYVADGRLAVVGDPLDEIRRILVLDVEHLLVHLLHGHAAAEDGGHGEVTPVAGVAGGHHVLGVKHLLDQLGDGEGSVLLGAPGGERREPRHEEVEPGEGHHVHRQLPQVRVELAGEPEAGRHSGHGGRHQVVEVAVRGGGQLQGPEADVVQGLVVDAEGLVRVFDQLVDRQGGVVGLDDRVRHLGRRHDAERVHDPVRVLLPDLGYDEGAHARPRASSQGVCQLEALEAVAALRLLADHVQHRVHQLGPLRVVSLGPVVARPRLPEHEVVRSEDLPERPRPHRVHRPGLQVHQDRPGHVLTPGRFVVVHVDPLQLQVRVAVVGARRVDAVFVRDHLPEFRSHLVAALACLNVANFSHLLISVTRNN